MLIENLNNNSGYSCRTGKQLIDLDFYFHELIQMCSLFLANDRKIAVFGSCLYLWVPDSNEKRKKEMMIKRVCRLLPNPEPGDSFLLLLLLCYY